MAPTSSSHYQHNHRPSSECVQTLLYWPPCTYCISRTCKHELFLWCIQLCLSFFLRVTVSKPKTCPLSPQSFSHSFWHSCHTSPSFHPAAHLCTSFTVASKDSCLTSSNSLFITTANKKVLKIRNFVLKWNNCISVPVFFLFLQEQAH